MLQAAHIRRLARGGEHRLDNGLLRSDVHTLFDRGYLAVDLLVRPRLREEFGNGRSSTARPEPRSPSLIGYRIGPIESPLNGIRARVFQRS
ncbi:HNH endonuclease signature motif containing protein [Nonomuraea sp. bgisy101]|uniref:HNH endonuclease signature motif containing protein n=1 Tax=Nonomuraea sp. bgisy101 TaxID=3413784 RepID=UPI003D70755F